MAELGQKLSSKLVRITNQPPAHVRPVARPFVTAAGATEGGGGGVSAAPTAAAAARRHLPISEPSRASEAGAGGLEWRLVPGLHPWSLGCALCRGCSRRTLRCTAGGWGGGPVGGSGGVQGWGGVGWVAGRVGSEALNKKSATTARWAPRQGSRRPPKPTPPHPPRRRCPP